MVRGDVRAMEIQRGDSASKLDPAEGREGREITDQR